MPWTGPEFRRKHNKGLSDNSASKAASIASQLISEGKDEASAIRIANSQVRPSAMKDRLKKIREKKGVPSG